MPLRRAHRLGSCILVLATLGASSARADEKQACLRAVEHAQNDRLDGKLRAAREGFVTCARPVCPDAIREDCTRWVTEVDTSMPTVVIHAAWDDGHDIPGLTVRLDGELHADAAVGRAVALDPGPHTFRFEAPSAAPVEMQTVIREGEKNRIVPVTLTRIDASRAITATPPVDQPMARPKRPVPASALIVGGFAIAAFAGFAYAGLDGTGELQHLRTTCAPSCDPSRVDSARREILVADILGLAALVTAGVATWLVFTRPTIDADAR